MSDSAQIKGQTVSDPKPNIQTARLHCPKCEALLRVPARASGVLARCPACSFVFVVPPLTELLEETASTWIEEDVDHLVQEHEQQILTGSPPQAASPTQNTPDPIQARPVRKKLRIGQLKTPQTPDHYEKRTSRGEKKRPSPPAANADPAPVGTEKNVIEPIALRKPIRKPVPVGAPESMPRLSVVRCTPAGVLFEFDSRWLEHEGFRASMPMRCAFTGRTDVTSLSARPLAFTDQAGATFRSPRDLETPNEQRLTVGASPRSVLQRMGLIEGLHRPFNHSVPYYVSIDHTSSSLSCHSVKRSDGKFNCTVLIPEGGTALEWMARVNSVCGDDYLQLEYDLSNLQGNAWLSLPERVRDRLGVWCPFEGGERFIHYLPDVDFGKADAGLAGIVITSNRLVFHKFHHGGQVMFDEAAILVACPQARGIELTLHAEDTHTKMAAVSQEDLAVLRAFLLENSEISLMDSPPPAAA
ncbi:MAG: hypothetical protein GC164_07860 [Phycisphaera sp.]|nr:hypothetical protein [Phycisphaera sp.]